MEVNTRERIKGTKFVKGGVYDVFSNDRYNYSYGIYFYPTSYPERMEYEYNTRGTLSKLSNKLSEPLKLLILYSRIYHSGIGKYIKFDKSKIYGKQPVSIIRSKTSYEVIDLSGLDLSYAKLRESHLVRIDLSNTNLSHADLTGANLSGTNLTGANLSGAKLGNTILKDIKSSGIIGSPQTLTKGYYFVDRCIIGPDTEIQESLSNKYKQIKIGNGNNTKQYLVGPNVDLTGVDLSKIAKFALNKSDLTGANLTGAILTGVYLRDVNLTGANLTGAILTGAELFDVNLTGANLTDTELTNSFFYDSVILTGIKTGGIKGIPKKLPKGYYLADGYIIGPNIDIPNNKNNTFNTIKLKKKYKKIKIKNKNNKTKEYIIGPNVDLTRVNLTGINLTGIDLTGAILTSAILTGAILTSAILTGANLTSAILTGANLTSADLTDANLTRIRSGHIKGNPRLPNGYKLRNYYIIGPNVNLYRADLTGIDLTRIDLTGAILTESILTGVDFTDAILTDVYLDGIISGHIKGNPRLPNGYKLRNGYIIGLKVLLTDANLTGVDLNGIELTGVDFTGANLTGVDFTHADFTRTISYHVSFTRANLTGTNFTGVDLTSAVLTGANLTRANLTGAILYLDSLSEEQRNQIIGQPNYLQRGQNFRENQGYLYINKILSNGNRISLNNKKKLNNNNTTTPHEISYKKLFDFLLQEKNQEQISKGFRIRGEPGVDAGGPTRTVFQKCYEVFRERYFEWDKDSVNYFILKDLSPELFEEFEKACRFMILLAKKAGVKILLPIHNLLLRLLLSDKHRDTFFENKNSFLENKNSIFVKKNNGTYSEVNRFKLNTFIEDPLDYTVLENSEVKRLGKNNGNVKPAAASLGAQVVASTPDPANNNGNNRNNRENVKPAAASLGAQVVASTLDPANNNRNNGNNNRNNGINPGNNGINLGNNGNNSLSGGKRLNNYNKSNQSKLMLGMFLYSQHFSTMEHFIQMKDFITKYWKPNPTIFTNKIDYSYEAFIKRLRFKLPDQTKQINIETFETKEFERYNTYPLIQLLLAYLKHSNEYRMTFTTFTCGSYTYDGIIKIFISNMSIHNLNPPRAIPPFIAHTCFHYIDVNIDLRPNCECPDVFNSTLTDDSNKNNNRDKCGYSLSKLNRVFEKREFNLA